MSGIGQETNNIRYVTAGTSLITMADDIINCDSAQGAIILVLPNIQGSGILSTGKCFKINDTANTAATHNITLVGTGGNKINDGATVIISTNGQSGYVKCLGLNDYLFDTPVTGGISGSGTLNYLAKYTPNGTTLGNSRVYDNGTSVVIGATSSVTGFEVYNSATDIVPFENTRLARINSASVASLLNFKASVNNVSIGTSTSATPGLFVVVDETTESHILNLKSGEIENVDGIFKLTNTVGYGYIRILTSVADCTFGPRGAQPFHIYDDVTNKFLFSIDGTTGDINMNEEVGITKFIRGVRASGLQVGNASLASGDLYVDTAANILANDDLVVGRKV